MYRGFSEGNQVPGTEVKKTAAESATLRRIKSQQQLGGSEAEGRGQSNEEKQRC